MKTPSPPKRSNLRLSPTPPLISPRRILYSYPLVTLISFNKKKNTKATIKGLYKLGAPLKGFLILWKLLFCSSFSFTFLCFFHHLEAKMLAIFSDSVVKAPQELIQVGNNSPTPKESASKLREAFSRSFSSSVSIDIGSFAQIFYSHDAQNQLQPRYVFSIIMVIIVKQSNDPDSHSTITKLRLFAAKDDIFCLFEGALENLGSLKQHYGLAKNANEVVLVMEAYRALRDRAPYPTNHVLGHMDGSFAFIVFDKATSRVLVASVSSRT